LASVTRNSKICSPSLVICLYHETPLHGRLHKLVGSCLPLSNKTCQLLVFTLHVYCVSRVSRSLCSPFCLLMSLQPLSPGKTSLHMSSFRSRPLRRNVHMKCCISCMLSNYGYLTMIPTHGAGKTSWPPNVKLQKANAERYLLRAANGSFPHATLILSSCTPGCRQLTCAAACA